MGVLFLQLSPSESETHIHEIIACEGNYFYDQLVLFLFAQLIILLVLGQISDRAISMHWELYITL